MQEFSPLCRRVPYKMTAGASHEPCHLIVKFTAMARELDELTCMESTSRPRLRWPLRTTFFLKMGSKHVEDIIKIKMLVYKRCILLVYIL